MEDADLGGLLAQLDTSLEKLEPSITQLTTKPLNERISNTASSSEAVDIINNYTFLLLHLLASYLNLLGENPEKNETLQEEFERAQRYVSKYKKLDSKNTNEAKVNAETAKRFISAAIGKQKSSASISSSTPVINASSEEKKNTPGPEKSSKKHSSKNSDKVLKPDKPKNKKKKEKK